jgi:hypothetical protein
MPNIQTSDLGLMLRDFIEDGDIFPMGEKFQEEEGVTVAFIDVSDPNNPLVHLENGQRFRVRIIAE